MSATIETNLFKKYYENFNFTMVNLSGSSNLNIDSFFLKENPQDYLKYGINIIKTLIKKEIEEDKTIINNDIIFFVTWPNEWEIICNQIWKITNKIKCIEVYWGIDLETEKIIESYDYFKSVYPNINMRVFIATNVAESWLTINGIKYVIDWGYELISFFDCEHQIKILEKKLITRAQVKQRKGRTGRTIPGYCYHLYTKELYENLEEYPKPAILKDDLWWEILKL